MSPVSFTAVNPPTAPRIETPPKTWKPKPQARYTPRSYGDEFDDDLFVFKEHGRSLARTPDFFHVQRDPADIIQWDPAKHQAEFDKGLRIHPSTPDWVRRQLVSTIQRHWDSFCEEGMRRPILGIEFHIDTGDAQPIAVRMGSYGPLESVEIMKQVNALHHNGLIRLCGGPWAFRIVLAPKPHQEDVTDIHEFIWRMCVNYRPLNTITLPFAYPIPRCDDAISDFGAGCVLIYFLSLDARSGFHQIKVAKTSQEKLAFMAPDYQKYTYNVLPFGPTNGPPVYTAMMVLLQRQWHALAVQVIRQHEREQARRLLDSSAPSTTTSTTTDSAAPSPAPSTAPSPVARFGSKIIIDDILIWATTYMAALLYFDCVCRIFVKHRVSFKLPKCELFYPRLEFVGHDLTASGQHPARSKYQLIADWALPATSRALQSFVSLCGFYQRYQPWFEIHVRELRRLIKAYRGGALPLMAWSPELVATFNELKKGLTSSPCLARPDPSKPFFLKTDWSKTGMGYILMQPDDSPESAAALKALQHGQHDLFDVRKTGARLRPVAFGARRCDEREGHFHSIVGEAAAARYAISKERKWLWGVLFYLLCDCNALRSIVEYEGTNYMLARWAQELLGYNFLCLHRPDTMMQDVDGVSRHPDPLIDSYERTAQLLDATSKQDAPTQYEPSAFPPSVRRGQSSPAAKTSMIVVRPPPEPFLVHPVRAIPSFRASASVGHQEARAALQQAAMSVQPTWFSCNPCFVSSINVVLSHHPGTQFIIAHQCRAIGNAIARARTGDVLTVVPYDGFTMQFVQFIPPREQLLGYDAHCYARSPTLVLNWLHHQAAVIAYLATRHGLQRYFLTVRIDLSDSGNTVVWDPPSLPGQWTQRDAMARSSEFGDCVAAHRRVLYGSCSSSVSLLQPTKQQPPVGFGDYLPFHADPSSWTHVPVIQSASKVPLESSFLPRVTHVATNPDGSFIPCYDLAYPAPEWSWERNDRLSPGFSVFHHVDAAVPALYPVTAQDFSRFLDYDEADQFAFTQLPEASQDTALRHCTPPALLSAVMNSLHSPTTTSVSLTTAVAPSDLDWTPAYNADPETKLIWDYVQANPTDPPPKALLSRVHADYRLPLRENRIVLQSNRLVLLRPVPGTNRSLALIIVPSSLRDLMFRAYHAAPSAGHMDAYKTIHRLRLRFFWPALSAFVRVAIRRCPHCVLANSTKNDAASLMYSFPLSEPFYLVFGDLWTPGVTSPNASPEYWLIVVEDITGVAIPVHVGTDPHASSLAALFMKHILLRVGLCSAVCVDDDGKFKGLFQAMCEALELRFLPLAKGNHQGMRVERFNRYLNKVCTIAANDRGHMPSAHQAVDVAAYAWNSAPIEGTDVIRSLPAFGRIFRFPFDVNLASLPHPTDDCAAATIEFLNATASTKQFATEVLGFLKEDRVTAHRERVNQRRREADFKVGDHVTVRVQTQSNADAGRPKKLLYKASGPFVVVTDLGFGAYHVQRAGNPHAALRKQHARDMFLLPPSLKPCEPLDAADLRYLNFERAPLSHPLLANLDIEGYNEKWFPPSTLRATSPPPPPPPLSDSPYPTIASLNEAMLSTNPPPTERTPSPSEAAPPNLSRSNTTTLDEAIIASQDRLFFISYTPPGVLRPSWYLVGVDLNASPDFSQSRQQGVYVVDFFVRPVADKYLSDISSRWWPEWREFCWSKDETYIELGDRVEIPPGTRANSKKYVQFSLEVNLSDPAVYLYGPFNFKPHANGASRPRDKIAAEHWHALASRVHGCGVPAPLLTDVARTHKRRKRGKAALRALVSSVLSHSAQPSAFAQIVSVTSGTTSGGQPILRRRHIPPPTKLET